MNNPAPKIFLSAEWRWLVMMNYEIGPEVLLPYVPIGTELDLWKGKMFASMVGFLFLKTRIKGFPIPFHQNFEEVNLRFYVRHKADDGWRRGVVFIKEIVPRSAIAFVARNFYNENYVALRMAHRLEMADENLKSVRYEWRFRNRENFMQAETLGLMQPPAEGSLSEFIAEHYWGYARQRDGSTNEYRVEHPRWNVAQASFAKLDCDLAGLYGETFANFLNKPPVSAFIADGSPVTVSEGIKL